MNMSYVLTVPHGTKVEIKYEERRDPNRKMYQYRTSADPRIRALERRGVSSDLYMARYLKCVLTGVERRSGKERRIYQDPDPRIIFARRFGDRRKS